ARATGPELAARPRLPILEAVDPSRRADAAAPPAPPEARRLSAEPRAGAAESPTPPLHEREGADRKRAEGADLSRHRVETEARIGHAIEVAQVLGDGNARAQENGVRRAAGIRGVVDVQGVDADERGALIPQPLGARAGQEGMAVEVAVRSPV